MSKKLFLLLKVFMISIIVLVAIVALAITILKLYKNTNTIGLSEAKLLLRNCQVKGGFLPHPQNGNPSWTLIDGKTKYLNFRYTNDSEFDGLQETYKKRCGFMYGFSVE